MQAVSVTQTVFLVRQPAHVHPPTWFAVHDMARLSRISCTKVLAFSKKNDADMCARSLEDYHVAHGHYPVREFLRKPMRLEWMYAAKQPPRTLEVVAMSLAEVTIMVKGTGMHISVVEDAQASSKTVDIVMPFDRSLVCARLTHALTKM